MRVLILTSFLLAIFLNNAAKADPGTTAAVLQQTVTQTLEHLKDLEQAIQQIKLLKSQLANTNNLLALAQKNAEGVDGLRFGCGSGRSDVGSRGYGDDDCGKPKCADQQFR